MENNVVSFPSAAPVPPPDVLIHETHLLAMWTTAFDYLPYTLRMGVLAWSMKHSLLPRRVFDGLCAYHLTIPAETANTS